VDLHLLKLRDNKNIKNSFTVFVFLWGVTGTVLAIFRAAFADYQLAYFLITISYFTTQSNLFITLISLFFLLGFSNRKWFSNLSFIALINIVMTSIIFHSLLVPYVDHVSFLQQILHTINPILFIILYFLFIDTKIHYKKLWISLIYPLIYLILVYSIVEPFLGNYLESRLPNHPSVRFVYPFLNPSNYEYGVVGLIGFIVGILTPIICLFSLIMIYFKRLLEKKLT
jgi:hypothetical protein